MPDKSSLLLFVINWLESSSRIIHVNKMYAGHVDKFKQPLNIHR